MTETKLLRVAGGKSKTMGASASASARARAGASTGAKASNLAELNANGERYRPNVGREKDEGHGGDDEVKFYINFLLKFK